MDLTATEAKIARRWRGKLFSRDKDSRPSRQQQIDDFLAVPKVPQPGERQTAAAASGIAAHTERQPPRLDIDSLNRWPAADSPSSPAPRKKRRREGLRVSFSPRPPSVIGEGGEEADEPTSQIGRSGTVASLAGREPTLPVVLGPSAKSDLLSVSAAGLHAGSRLSWRDDGSREASFAERIRARMRDEEALALKDGREDGKEKDKENREYGENRREENRREENRREEIRRDGENDIRSPDSAKVSFWSSVMAALPEASPTSPVNSRSPPPYARTRRDPRSESRQTDYRSESRQADHRTDPRTDPRSDPRAESRTDYRSESKQAFYNDAPPYVRTEPKQASYDPPYRSERTPNDSYRPEYDRADPRSESRQTDYRSDPRSESRQTDYRSDPRTDPRSESRQTDRQIESRQTDRQTESRLADRQIESRLADRLTDSPPYTRSESRQAGHSKSPSGRLKDAAGMLADTALAAFSAHADRYLPVFCRAAESVKPVMETSLSEWLRACVWWFIKGRAELETAMRSPPSSRSLSSGATEQAIVNLAKAWWISQQVISRHPDLGHALPSHSLIHQSIVSHLRALSMSMQRNGILPSSPAASPPSEPADTSIWIRYPFFAPGISSILSGALSKSMLIDHSAAKPPDIAETMPISDTVRHFCYGRMFVDVGLRSSDDDADAEQFAIPCMLSITRDRSDWHVIATLTSQNELVNLTIQADKKLGPTWQDVDWHVRYHSLTLRLPRGFELDIKFHEPDFKMLWKIVEYSRKVQEDMQPAPGERMVFADILKLFQYTESSANKTFPVEPTQRCRIQLFEKTTKITEGTGTREFHRGFRLFAVTSPKLKTLSSVSHVLGSGSPIVFGYLRGDDGAPAMMLKHVESGVEYSMLLTFEDTEPRAALHSLLIGISPSDEETKSPDLALTSFTMLQAEDPSSPISSGCTRATYLKFEACTASVINARVHGSSPASTVLSERLRVFVSSSWGSVTDRINIGPGDLKISLDVNAPTVLSLLRPPQDDLAVAVAENLIPKEIPAQMQELLNVSKTKQVIRRYKFATLPDMHQFQQAITGYKVLFDGTASLFTIARRRMVVPIYKKWEASRARLQIIQQEKNVQLVAFLAGFSHGRSMNFVLKSTDNFESFNRSGKYGIKIVDAKFALPKNCEDESADYLCLDMPEYPGEHDDITIGFDSENDRYSFQSAVPGSVKEPSRMGSLRK